MFAMARTGSDHRHLGLPSEWKERDELAPQWSANIADGSFTCDDLIYFQCGVVLVLLKYFECLGTFCPHMPFFLSAVDHVDIGSTKSNLPTTSFHSLESSIPVIEHISPA